MVKTPIKDFSSSVTRVVDVGNSHIKSLLTTDTEPTAIRSIYVTHTGGMTNKLRGTVDSPVVMYQGVSLHFGKQAYKYQPVSPQLLAGEVKTRSFAYVHAVLSTFQPLSDGRTVYDVDLRISVPNYELDKDHVEELFKNKQMQATVNGHDLNLTFKTVTVYREGYGSYVWAKENALLKSNKGHTLVVDIGGNTMVTQVLDDSGDLVGEAATFNDAGALSLASSISSDGRLIKALEGNTPNVALILDAFLTENVYAASGYSFTSWLPDHKKPWYMTVMSKIATRYPTSVLADVSTVVFTGGSTHLLPKGLQETNSKFVLLTDPEFASVRGLAL